MKVSDKAGKSIVGSYGYEEYAAVGYFNEELSESKRSDDEDNKSLLQQYISKFNTLKDKFIQWIDQ